MPLAEALEGLIQLFPELLKLGGWGAFIFLVVTRRVVMKGEKDEAIAVEKERIADKDGQIAFLNKALDESDEAMQQLATAWQAAVNLFKEEIAAVRRDVSTLMGKKQEDQP